MRSPTFHIKDQTLKIQYSQTLYEANCKNKLFTAQSEISHAVLMPDYKNSAFCKKDEEIFLSLKPKQKASNFSHLFSLSIFDDFEKKSISTDGIFLGDTFSISHAVNLQRS